MSNEALILDGTACLHFFALPALHGSSPSDCRSRNRFSISPLSQSGHVSRAGPVARHGPALHPCFQPKGGAVLVILQVPLRSHRAGSEAKSFCTSRVEAICWRNCRPNCHSLDIARLTTADRPAQLYQSSKSSSSPLGAIVVARCKNCGV